MLSSLKITTLGQFTIAAGGQVMTSLPRKAKALLIYLVRTRRPHNREFLTGLLWDEFPPEQALNSLRVLLTALRRTVASSLTITRQTVAFNPDSPCWFDVAEVEAAIAAWSAHRQPPSQPALARLEQALALYQGEFLPGFSLPECQAFEEWLFMEREQLHLAVITGYQQLIQGYRDVGLSAAGIEPAHRLLQLDHLREASYQSLMQLFALSGQRSAALRQYETCRRMLAEELGVDPCAETTALHQQIVTGQLGPEAQPPTQPAPPPSATTPTPVVSKLQLPTHSTPFVGRQQELAEIVRLLRDEPDCRLLTLFGAGGMGKTRLAVQAAAEAGQTFAHGATFVALAPLSSVTHLVSTLASALALPSRGQAISQRHILNEIGRMQPEMLLVFDNFEHLLAEGSVELLPELLRVAPRLKLLVTSRQRLNLHEEWGFEVQGLAYPSTPPVLTEAWLQQAETASAVNLFVQSARRAHASFRPTRENAPDVIRICQLTQGMPLGLELAATWVQLISCREIAQKIEQSLDILTTTLRNIPERHRNLRAVFQHSWSYLKEDEQQMFMKLSVFRGSFATKTAQQVTGATLPTLMTFVQKGLLHHTPNRGFEIHPLLRQYAMEKLQTDADEERTARERHAAYYAAFLQARANDLKGKQQRRALEEISAVIDDVRAAWDWAVAHKNLALLDQAQESLCLVCDFRGWYQEGEAAFRQAVAALREEPHSDTELIVHGRLLYSQGWLSARLGRVQQGQALLEQSLTLLRQVASQAQWELAVATAYLGVSFYYGSAYARARQYLEEALGMAVHLGADWVAGQVKLALGLTAKRQGELATARRWLYDALEAMQQGDVGVRRGYALNALGSIALLVGDYVRAEEHFLECFELRQTFGDRAGVAYALMDLGDLARVRGQYQLAKEYLQHSRTLAGEVDDPDVSVRACIRLGSLTGVLGEEQYAEQCYQESQTLLHKGGRRENRAFYQHEMGNRAYAQQAYSQAKALYEESLARYEATNDPIGIVSCWRHLGHVAGALAEPQTASDYYRQALTVGLEMGVNPVILDVLVGLAQRKRGKTSDHKGAVELLTLVVHHPASEHETKEKAKHLLKRLRAALPPKMREAIQTGREKDALEMVVKNLLNELGTPSRQTALAVATAQELPPQSSPVPNPEPPDLNLFRREGAYWTIRYQGTVCRLKDAKGLHYLAALLRDPGREFHVIDLATLTASEPPSTASAGKLNAKSLAAQHLQVREAKRAEDQLDAQAKVAYQRRLEDLRDELEEAERFHDLARADKARTEMDFISRELTAAYGLSGRARKSGSNSEKARQAVGYCIRSSLKQIRPTHPALWRHLFAALKTGTFCSYNPELPTAWEV